MFYLITEKDGLIDDQILVNINNLKSIEVVTGKGNYSVRVTHKDSEIAFVFDPKKIFDVNHVITEIAQQSPMTFNNNFIVVTDVDNITNISNNFGRSSEIIDKASKILININDFGVVYDSNNEYIITIANKKITIKESPEEIYQQLLSKIVKKESTISDNKSQWKKTL